VDGHFVPLADGTSAECIDGLVSDDREEPGPERPPGVVGVSGAVDAEQTFLDTVVEDRHVAEFAQEEGANRRGHILEELPIGLAVALLRSGHPLTPTALVLGVTL
jgi:hypothetical protein